MEKGAEPEPCPLCKAPKFLRSHFMQLILIATLNAMMELIVLIFFDYHFEAAMWTYLFRPRIHITTLQAMVKQSTAFNINKDVATALGTILHFPHHHFALTPYKYSN
jgi:hypothetical protein